MRTLIRARSYLQSIGTVVGISIIGFMVMTGLLDRAVSGMQLKLLYFLPCWAYLLDFSVDIYRQFCKEWSGSPHLI